MAPVRVAVVLVSALALAGCGLGESGTSDEITAEQLAIMVLPRDVLAPGSTGLQLDAEDSGRLSAREVADGTTDPRDDAADLRQAGWLDGYELTWSDPNRSVAVKRGEGLMLGGSAVHLFDTATSARAYLLDQVRSFERYRGKTVDGVRLLRVEVFDASLGDEAWGIELAARARGTTLHLTGVLFRSGRLAADAGFMRADDGSLRGQALKAAEALESRITRVLAGDLDAEPVPLPYVAPQVTQKQLAKMTLALDDLPAGAFLSEEGRGRRDDSVTFFRNFDVQQTMVGSSHLMFLRAETEVFETEAAAELLMRYVSGPNGRAKFAHGVLRGFRKLAGARARNVRVAPMRDAGPGASGIVVTFDLPTGRYRVATVIVRSGRSVAVVSGFCTARAVHPDDLPPLGRKARARLRSVPV